MIDLDNERFICLSIFFRPESIRGDSLGDLVKDSDMKMRIRPVLVRPGIDLPDMFQLGVVDRQGSLRSLGRH